jgi:predicted dienelactone hydrolase
MSFAVDRLETLNDGNPSSKFRGRLDLQRIGAFGHSLGGAESLQFCHDDASCKAGIDVDGAPFGSVVTDGVKQPFMFLLSDHSDEPADETGPIEANLRSIFDRLPRDRRLQVTIRGATHFGFADDVKNHMLMSILRMRGNRLDARRQLIIASRYINAFFDVYLREQPVSRLELQREPEVECVR